MINAQTENRKAGVALIIVLGLLALMLILSFAFSVSMETERKASINAVDGMQGRQTAMAIMPRVAIHVADRMMSKMIDAPGDFSARLPYPERMLPSWQVNNQGSQGTTQFGVCIPFGIYAKNDKTTGKVDRFWETAAPWVPAPLQNGARYLADNQMRWKTIFELNQNTGFLDYGCTLETTVAFMQTTPFIFCALILNCSGFLDPNILAKADTDIFPRRFGTNRYELQIGLLPPADREVVARVRTNSISETAFSLPHLTNMHPDVYHLFPFSHFPLGQYFKRWDYDAFAPKQIHPSDLLPCAYIGGPSNGPGSSTRHWSSVAMIRDAFSDAFYNPPTATTISNLVNALDDYVDRDYQSRHRIAPGYNPYGPSQEPVPAFNELLLESVYTCTPNPGAGLTNYTFELNNRIALELWHPYNWDPESQSAGVSNSYHLRSRFTLESDNASLPTVSLPIADPQIDFKMAPRNFAVFRTNAATRSFTTTNFQLGRTVKLTLTHQQSRLTMDKYAPPSSNPGEIDWLPANSAYDDIELGFLDTAPTNRLAITNYFLAECIDPRLNFDVKNTNFWQITVTNTTVSPDSLGDINRASLNHIASTNNLCDSDTMMYTANTNLFTAGELGYLCYDRWKTLRLVVHPSQSDARTLHRVLDTFTVDSRLRTPTNPTPAAVGIVNPNTEYPIVLATAFANMLLDWFPPQFDGDPGTYTITSNKAIELATAITNVNTRTRVIDDGNHAPTGVPRFFWNVSDMGDMKEFFYGGVANDLSGIATNEFMREAFLRNSSGLFNTRHTQFTAIVGSGFVQAPYKFEIPTNYHGDWQYYVNENAFRSAERRAVYVFWMDAWTGKMSIRLLKWLDS